MADVSEIRDDLNMEIFGNYEAECMSCDYRAEFNSPIGKRIVIWRDYPVVAAIAIVVTCPNCGVDIPLHIADPEEDFKA